MNWNEKVVSASKPEVYNNMVYRNGERISEESSWKVIQENPSFGYNGPIGTTYPVNPENEEGITGLQVNNRDAEAGYIEYIVKGGANEGMKVYAAAPGGEVPSSQSVTLYKDKELSEEFATVTLTNAAEVTPHENTPEEDEIAEQTAETLKNGETISEPLEKIGNFTLPAETSKASTLPVNEIADGAVIKNESGKTLTLDYKGEEPVSVIVDSSNGSVTLKGNFETVEINGGKSVTLTDATISGDIIINSEPSGSSVTINTTFTDDVHVIQSETSKPINISNKNTEAENTSIIINTPNSTVTLNSGNYEEVSGEVSDNTLKIKPSAHIKRLVLTNGNVIILSAHEEDIANTVEEYELPEGSTIDIERYDVSQSNMAKLKGTANCKLVGDITTTTAFVAPVAPAWNTVWDLNGHTLEINTTGGRAALMIRYTSKVEINDSSNNQGKFLNNNDYGVWMSSTYEDAECTINGGCFEACTHVIYAENGFITINGGEFKMHNEEADKDANGHYKFLLNCLDSSYTSGKANIYVKGGKFYNFDPANAYGEPGAPISYVVEGYQSVCIDEEQQIYEVRPINQE